MQEIFKIAESYLKGNDLEFFKRAWSSDLFVYKKRLLSIDFKNLKSVLDAGFGMGQWLIKLGEMNKEVHGIEYSNERVNAVRLILAEKRISNINIQQGSIEDLPYADNTFEAIFCYGVIFITDYRKTLKEFKRVLKLGGKLYFTANDLGWYLFCLIEQHNKSDHYDPRSMAINTIDNSIAYYSGMVVSSGRQLIIKRDILSAELSELGFSNIIIKSEGHINLRNDNVSNSFYKHIDYLNQGFIFEVYATKK